MMQALVLGFSLANSAVVVWKRPVDATLAHFLRILLDVCACLSVVELRCLNQLEVHFVFDYVSLLS
jgi:hypothetical protein